MLNLFLKQQNCNLKEFLHQLGSRAQLKRVGAEDDSEECTELWHEALTNTASVALRLEYWFGAAEACEIVLKEKPGHLEVLFLLARAQRRCDDLPSAEVKEQLLYMYTWS